MNDEPADARDQAEPDPLHQSPQENGTPADLRAECERLRRELAEAQAKLSALATDNRQVQEELARTLAERDEYSNAVHYLTQRQYAITQEDIAEAEREGLTLDQFVGKLEEIVNRKS